MFMLTVFAALALAATAATDSEARTFELDAGFDDLVERLLNIFRVPGLSLAVVKDGKIASKGYGYASLPDTPATPDTLWYTGSTTKAFVATAAGLMVQNDSLPNFRWSTPMTQLMPGDFVLTEEYQTAHTTLEDALSHRSGLPRHDISYGWANATALDLVRRLRYLPLTAEPRTRWQYCNIMYGTIGALLERHTGLRLGEVLSNWIWEPLGMDSTTFSPDKAVASGNLATGYHWDVKSGNYAPEQLFDVLPIAGAGATISSMNDYALWAKALLAAANGETNHTSPVSNVLLHQLWNPRSFVDVSATRLKEPATIAYGLGWMSLNIGELSVITHSGGVPGFGTQVFLVPKLNFGFVSSGNNIDGAANVGGVLFLSLLKDKKLDVVSMKAPDLEQMLQELPPSSKNLPEKWADEENATLERLPKIPLPGHMEHYLGLYAHPAYGIFNVSLHSADHPEASPITPSSQTPLHAKGTLRLLAQPTQRSWRAAFILTHSTNAFFSSEFYYIHGPTPEHNQITCGGREQDSDSTSSLRCKDEAVWEKLGHSRAVFEHGPEGKIERLGIELEPEQVRSARKKGDWRDGMIWFARQV